MNSQRIGTLTLFGGIMLLALMAFVTKAPRVAGAADLPKVKFGLPKAGMFGLGGLYVIDKKLDRKHGWILQPHWARVSQIEQLVALGKLPAGLATAESSVRANIKGIPLRLIQPYMTPHQHVLVRKDSPYKALKDLKGKSVATTREVTSQYNMFDFMVRKGGMRGAEEEFELKKLGAAAIIAVLETGDVEAATLWEAHVSRLLATGKYRVLVAFRDELAKLLNTEVKMMGWVGAHKDWVKKNSDLVVRMRASWQEGIRGVQKDEEHFRKYAGKLFKIKKKDVLKLGWSRAKTFLLPPDHKWPDKANLNAEKDYLLGLMKIGMFPKEAAGVIDKLFVP